MSRRWERELRTLHDTPVPLESIRARVSGGPSRPDRSSTTGHRIAAGAIAFLVFTAAAVLAWRAFGGSSPSVVGQPLASQLLYVLDGAPAGKASNGAVVAVEASSTTADVVARYRLGANSDVVVSPDGSRLYGVGFVFLPNGAAPSRLRVFDAATATPIGEVDVPNYADTIGFHISQQIAISRDGGRVFVLVIGDPVDDSPMSPLLLATFDVASGEILPHLAPLDGCRRGLTILPDTGLRVVVVCGDAEEVRFITLTELGGIETERRLSLAPPMSTSPSDTATSGTIATHAVLSPDGSTLYAVTEEGFVSVVNVNEERVEQTSQLTLPSGSIIAAPQVRLSPDGDALLLPLDAAIDALHARNVLMVDTTTWESTATVATPVFSSFEVSGDGARLFMIDYRDTALDHVVIEGQPGIETLGSVASRPQAIYAAP